MKTSYKITWPAPKTRLVLKSEAVFWRWWQEQDAREAKNAAEQRLHPDQVATPPLMVWSDDGGPGA